MPPVALSDGLAFALGKRDEAVSPTAVFNTLTARSANTMLPVAGGQGAINPGSINMQGLMALFALIGAVFVLAAIWFFFWAKNGGFVWRKGDWEEYKSTVLRRKGPDGRTLSNATKSTKLGGGSVVGRGYSDDGYTVTDMTEPAETVTEEKKPRRKKRNKQKLLRKRKDDTWEGAGDDDVRAYRNEKPARVGGLNREAEGTYYGTDYTPSDPPTAYNASENHRENDRSRNNRNVSGYSFTAGSEDVLSSQATEEPLIRDDPARTRPRESKQQQGRRSRQTSPRKQQRDRSSMPGGYTEPLDFASRPSNSEYQYSTVETDDGSGTKSYHHPIPGLSKGYRRDRENGGRSSRRRDSLSDSDA